MDTVLTNNVALAEEVVDSLKTELDELKIRGGYNTTSLMGYFQVKIDLFVNRISILEVKIGEETINDDDGRCCLFESRSLHLW